MKRFILLFLILLCFTGCRAPASAPADTQAPPSPVIAMSSPEILTPEADPSTEPRNSTDPAPSTEPKASTEPAPSAELVASTEPDPADAEGMYMLVNGSRIALGMNYAEVKEDLGAQTAPEQEIGSCDNPTLVKTVHSYPGLAVTEDKNGMICAIELNSLFAGEGDAALKGTVGLGTTMEEALAVLGEPENAASAKDDCMLIYRQDGQDIYVYFLNADSQDTVSGIGMMLP